MTDLELRNISLTDAAAISGAFAKIGWNKPEEQYVRYYKEQESGTRDVIVALMSNEFCGYATILWESNYAPFKESKIPEIVDLNVLPHFRRSGVASAILDEAERRISVENETVGIGVGLYGDYGAAQRMYVLRGYVPDGRGITYNYEAVSPGSQVRVDDDLVFWFTKRFQ